MAFYHRLLALFNLNSGYMLYFHCPCMLRREMFGKYHSTLVSYDFRRMKSHHRKILEHKFSRSPPSSLLCLWISHTRPLFLLCQVKLYFI